MNPTGPFFARQLAAMLFSHPRGLLLLLVVVVAPSLAFVSRLPPPRAGMKMSVGPRDLINRVPLASLGLANGPAPSSTALFFTGASASSDVSCACRGKSCTALSAASFSIPGLTPCQSAVAVACVQGTFVLASLAGARFALDEQAIRTAASRINGEDLTHLAYLIKQIKNASGASKANSVFAFVSELYRTGVLWAVIKEAAKQMKWYDWAKFSVVFAAQLVAWFGTDGAALIAELVIFLPTAYDFYKSVDEAVDCCK